ncbi:putative DEAD-like helicase [Erwinia phage vB_EamM_MadMel]|uniref:Putative DEAD-like helicase n=1 Tax=Erwinia phage vB_EamM_MadMel TaxID=2060128 RepID=A0A2H5BJQ8_9CAUD|nr:putative DEAD-like helicase [Erwinia phage vB_EamM_MadMel]
MFDYLRRALGFINVEEKNDIITITGFNAPLATRDILKVWKTSKIAGYLFREVTQNKISFNSFFAIEVEYILKQLYEHDKTWSDRRGLGKILELLRKNTWMRNLEEQYEDIIDLNQLKYVKKTPLPEQRNWLNYYNTVIPRYGLRGALLSAAPGAGKTLCSIMTMLCRKKDYVIVIAPKKATRDVWERTITTELTTEESVWVAEYDQPYRKGTKWIVAHYERLDEVVKMVKELRLPNVGIILDESHNLNQKTKESIRTNLFVELCQASGSQDIVWASGTALTAMGTEAVPLFRTLIPGFTNDVELAMRKIWGKTATKANDILANRLGIVSFSVPKSKFMTTKPIEMTVKIKIKNGAHYTLDNIQRIMMAFIQERFKFYTDNKPAYQKIYDDALGWYEKTLHSPKEKEDFKLYNQYVNTFVTQGFDPYSMAYMSQYCNEYELKRIIPVIPDHMRKPFKDARSVIKYVDLKIKGECLGRVLGKERTMCHVELAEAIPFGTYIDNAKKKTLIFTDFVPALETMALICRGLGYKPVVVYGDTNKDLVEMVKSFRASEDVNPGIATFRSLAEAVPLTEANCGLMLNKPFRFHHYEQAVSRMHRIGQEDEVYIFNFVLDTGAMPNISTRSEDIMAWSKSQVDALMGLDRYGSNVEVEEIAEAVGLESFEESAHEHQFLSAGMEAWLDDLESQELVTEDIPMEVTMPRANKAFSW